MTCKHCCGADHFFDKKSATKEMNKYKRKGPRKSTKKLLQSLKHTGFQGKTLLDIGGGIGAIMWAFTQEGGKHITDVDSSSGYVEVAQSHAEELNIRHANFIIADFNDVHDEIEKHNLVTLDKVVCCYPDYKTLLSNAMSKTTDTLAITMPLGGLVSKTLEKLTGLYFSFKNNPFRTYIHDPIKVQAYIESGGFRLVHGEMSFPWLIRVYKRV